MKTILLRIFVAAFLLSLVTLAIVGAFAYRFYIKLNASLPEVSKLEDYKHSLPSLIYSEDKVKIGEIFSERRYPKALAAISPRLIKAFLAAEDARFYEHSGIDYQGLARASFVYLTNRSAKQGGSTITQQLAKTLLLTKERTIERKLKDMLLAQKIEKFLSKDKILELYLNTIFLGNHSYGVEAAAKNYFRKTTQELSWAECAMIAGLTPAPSAYAPTEHFSKAKVRQKFVLEQLLKHNWISSEEQEVAKKEKMRVFGAESPNTTVAPYFFMEVWKQLEKDHGLKDLAGGGYQVYTTVNAQLQQMAQKAVTDYLAGFESKQGFLGPVKKHKEEYLAALSKMLEKAKGNDEDMEHAIVVDLLPNLDAAAVVTQSGLGLLLAEDHRWALQAGRSKKSNIMDFANILAVGDEVRVKIVNRGSPRRIVKESSQLQFLKKFVSYYPDGPSYQGVRYFELVDREQIEAAALVADAHTGNVVVMVGGRDFAASEFNRATQSKRQVGSSVKPLYYGLAQDMGFSPVSLIDSPPLVLDNWKPENYNKDLIGRTTLRSSLIHSYNISSLQLFQALGSANVSAHFKKLGFSWPMGDLSLALGAGEASLAQMVSAYTPFANEGSLTPLRFISKIVDRDGKIIFNTLDDKKQEQQKIISTGAAYVTTAIMQDIIRMGTGTGAAGASLYAAGKTGTTNGYTDAWFLGVLPGWSAGVWVGFDDARKSMGQDGTGGKMAAPLWKKIIQETIAKKVQVGWKKPDDVEFIRADLQSGKQLFGKTGGSLIPVVKGTEPSSPRARHALGVNGFSSSGSADPAAARPADTSDLRGAL